MQLQTSKTSPCFQNIVGKKGKSLLENQLQFPMNIIKKANTNKWKSFF